MSESKFGSRSFWVGLLTVSCLAVLATTSHADMLMGLPQMSAADDAIVSLTYDGQEYVVANGDLVFGRIHAMVGRPHGWR